LECVYTAALSALFCHVRKTNYKKPINRFGHDSILTPYLPTQCFVPSKRVVIIQAAPLSKIWLCFPSFSCFAWVGKKNG
jgi:hypothetical protein